MKEHTTSDRLKLIMERESLKQVDILERCKPYCIKYNVKLAKNDLSQYVSGKVHPGQDKLSILALALNVSEAWLMGYDVPMSRDKNVNNILPIRTKRVPFLGDIACGNPIWADGIRGEYVDIDEDIKADFALRAKGDSMLGARIHDGDIVFVREQPDVENGEIAVVIIDNEATLKRVYKYEDSFVLNAENPAYKPMILREGDADNIKILGKAVAFQSKL